MSNKIGLAIAIHTINYGTFLQAFATQEAVRSLGYDTEILNINSVIDDVSRARKKYFLSRIFSLTELKSYRHIISAILTKKINKKYRSYISDREKCFSDFSKKYFSVGEICDSWKGLSKHCEGFSSVLVGSDQLWRPANIAGNFYTLNFVPEHVDKVSYATSFGLNEIRENQRDIASEFLNRIQCLSSREESGVKIIENLTGRNAEMVCDPTLLLGQERWNGFLDPHPIVDGDYVFVYLLGNDKSHRAYIRELAKTLSCKIVGPFEFLNLIKHAKCVCTDSFHGCVFSTIFEKDFYAFKRFSDKDKMSTNTRVVGLLKKIDALDRLVESYDCVSFDSIDYSKINERVDDFRNYSIGFLTKSLK